MPTKVIKYCVFIYWICTHTTFVYRRGVLELFASYVQSFDLIVYESYISLSGFYYLE